MLEVGFKSFKPAEQIVRCDGCGAVLARYSLKDEVPEFLWLTFVMERMRLDFCTPERAAQGMESRSCSKAILARARKWERVG